MPNGRRFGVAKVKITMAEYVIDFYDLSPFP